MRGWAPQLLILEHKAIGAFVSHCGESSIIEASSSWVPLLTWPLFAEQFVNEKLVTQVLKLGVSVSAQPSARFAGKTVKSERIEEAINRVMEGEEAEKIRTKVKEFGDSVKNAVERGGTSYKDLKVVLPCESVFLSLDLSLLESLEFKRRIKQIVDIIEEVKWEDIDPDMLTRVDKKGSHQPSQAVAVIFICIMNPLKELLLVSLSPKPALWDLVLCLDFIFNSHDIDMIANALELLSDLHICISSLLLQHELIYALCFELAKAVAKSSNVWSSFGDSLKVVIDWFILRSEILAVIIHPSSPSLLFRLEHHCQHIEKLEALVPTYGEASVWESFEFVSKVLSISVVLFPLPIEDCKAPMMSGVNVSEICGDASEISLSIANDSDSALIMMYVISFLHLVVQKLATLLQHWHGISHVANDNDTPLRCDVHHEWASRGRERVRERDGER
ncbi:UDP-glucuronosyl/UDP-glucosyltransferase [Dillenia turbinata]|uniref:UDP-glucuronosyl/UDP-glucosyltransferase n=1 Tax=Dillenia turbinata TaxID=194707 RepID=A0AAN8UJF9_9MAGN